METPAFQTVVGVVIAVAVVGTIVSAVMVYRKSRIKRENAKTGERVNA
jgi:hypothetical protein